MQNQSAKHVSETDKTPLSFEYEEIQRILPHRYPFLLVDRVIDGELGSFATGIKQVTGNEFFFQGHFPGQPVFPGVLQIEALAQVGAIAVLAMPEHQGKIALFAGVNRARFKGIVRPGDTLVMTTKFTGKKAGIGFAEGRATVDGKTVCQAEFMFALTDKA